MSAGKLSTGIIVGTLALALAGAGVFITTAGASPVALATPITPEFGPEIDDYATYDGQAACDPIAKPGVEGVRDLLDQTYGKHSSGIDRGCEIGGKSEHKEGRALDYMLDSAKPREKAAADDFLAWLLATDQHGNKHANARRLGVMYIIFNHLTWKSSQPDAGWQPRACDGTPNDCHTNHIHLSFSWNGALKRTSWWGPVKDLSEGVTVWQAETGTFLFDDNRDGVTDTRVTYGLLGDRPLLGDWAGLGRPGVGKWQSAIGIFQLDHDRDGITDSWVTLGSPGDVPLAGDWDGDGKDGVGVWQPATGRFLLDDNRDGIADTTLSYGNVTDIPVVGDWDGDGKDGIGIWQASTGRFYLDNDADGVTDSTIVYGNPGDTPVVGDWNGDGKDGIGVWQSTSGRFHLDENLDGVTDSTVTTVDGNGVDAVY